MKSLSHKHQLELFTVYRNQSKYNASWFFFAMHNVHAPSPDILRSLAIEAWIGWLCADTDQRDPFDHWDEICLIDASLDADLGLGRPPIRGLSEADNAYLWRSDASSQEQAAAIKQFFTRLKEHRPDWLPSAD